MAVAKGGMYRNVSGRIGEQLYKVVGGQQIISIMPSNTITSAQALTMQRAKIGNIVAVYKLFGKMLKTAFEDKPENQTDYNRFVSVNMPISNIYTNSTINNTGQCLLAPYQISQGSLATITYSQGKSDINLGTNTLPKTVGAFAKAIVENNPDFQYDDQLTIFLAQQMVSADGVYHGFMRACKVELLADSDESLALYMDTYVTVKDKCLTITLPEGITAYAFLHSRKTTGVAYNSTQRLELSDTQLIEAYSDPVKAGVTGDGIYLTPDRRNTPGFVRRGDPSGTPVMPGSSSGGSGGSSGGGGGGLDTGD